MLIKSKNMSFAGKYIEKRLRKNNFLRYVNQIIDWEPIEKEISKAYKKGMSVDGRKAYPGLLLFKMSLLQIWYGLSDERVEEHVQDSLSAMTFCDLQLEDDVPDHSTLCRFRNELTEKKAWDRILKKVNKQLVARKIIINKGQIVDASITESPWSPKGKAEYEIAEDRDEDNRQDKDKGDEDKSMRLVRKEKPGVDSEARWLKKGNKLHFGYKKHMMTDREGIVTGVHTTPANEHDSKGLEPLIKKHNKKNISDQLMADKGYQVPDNEELLKEMGIKNRIQHKAYRNRPLTDWQKRFNKLISQLRYVVERTFGGMKRWFGAGRARYKGLAKVHGQHVLEAIAHNLYRSPGLVMSKCIEK